MKPRPPPPTWSKTLSGQVAGNNLNAGDKVIARFFDANGETTTITNSS
jgi:chitin-binding protein